MKRLRRFSLIFALCSLLLMSQSALAQNDPKQPRPTSTPEDDDSDAIVLDLDGRSADDPDVWINVLSDEGFIDGDGELLFEAEMTSTSLGGPFNVSDDSESTYPNFAGGGLMSFRPEDQEDNLCGFVMRVIVNEDDDFDNLLFVGVDAFDYVLVLHFNADDPDADPLIAEAPAPDDVVFHQPQYLTYVLNDNLMTVFVNGESVLEDVEIDLPEPDRRGEVDPALAGAVLEYSCVMTSAWTYGFE